MDEFIDKRDSNRYKIIKIGNLLWFAENLKYQGVPHHFPNRDSDHLHRYGCLYTWENAMKACPKDWRLPTKTDFNNLLSYVDKHKSNNSTKFLSLIAKSTAWTKHSNQGLDDFGFSAMPAGLYNSGNYNYFGYTGYWWSSTEYSSSSAYNLYLDNGCTGICSSYKTIGYSIRCVKEV